MNKICGIYKITNTITGDFYIGSSNNVKRRWAAHKWPSVWKKYPNNQMYLDFQKYGLNKFAFEILAEVEESSLKETEQQFIETLKPTYNNYRANGLDFERYKETNNKYQKSDKDKESHRKANNKYNKSDKGKESLKKAQKKYYSQLCSYNGQTLTLRELSLRFKRQGISNPTLEAKKYLLD